jgi:hypothetical protein
MLTVSFLLARLFVEPGRAAGLTSAIWLLKPTHRMRQDEKRDKDVRMRNQPERAPPHWLNPLVGIKGLFPKLCTACPSIYTYQSRHYGTTLHETIRAVSPFHHFHNQGGLVGKASGMDELQADRFSLGR